MRTKVVLTVATILVLVIGVAAIGSNMGFKISISLEAGGWSNWVGLPYFNSYTNAADVFSDVPPCTQVSRWDNATGTFQTYNGSARSNNFTLNKGEGIVVKVSSHLDWVVVGSHDPGFAKPLEAGGYSNWVAIPYHTTATDASGIFGEITPCTQVSRWDNASGTFQTYNGSARSNNFTLMPGEACVVKVSSSFSWTPAHY